MRTVSDICKVVNTNNIEIASAAMETEKGMSAAAPMSPSTPTASMFINGEERLPENRYQSSIVQYRQKPGLLSIY